MAFFPSSADGRYTSLRLSVFLREYARFWNRCAHLGNESSVQTFRVERRNNVPTVHRNCLVVRRHYVAARRLSGCPESSSSKPANDSAATLRPHQLPEQTPQRKGNQFPCPKLKCSSL